MFYELNNWPRSTTNNFTLKNCSFDAVRLIGNADENEFTCNGQEIEFDRKDIWNYENDFARNVLIFGVDNTSSSHTDNQKNSFLVLGEGQTKDMSDRLVQQKRKLALTSVKQRQNFVWDCIVTVLIVIYIMLVSVLFRKCIKRFYKKWKAWNFFKWYCVWFLTWS